MKVNYIIVNPSGNITILVFTPVPIESYNEVASKLLGLHEDAEQVGFVTGKTSMNMAGMEFCGNATRAFSLFAAGATGEENLLITTSGIDHPIKVHVDAESKCSTAYMPLPSHISPFQYEHPDFAPIHGTLIDFGGISHLVIRDLQINSCSPILSKYPLDKDIPPAKQWLKQPQILTPLFLSIKDSILSESPGSAFGVMFYDSTSQHMIPIVYVKDIDTYYFEGSCASGTTALAYTLAKEGCHTFSISQPKGQLSSTVICKNGVVTSITIEGQVDIGYFYTIDL